MSFRFLLQIFIIWRAEKIGLEIHTFWNIRGSLLADSVNLQITEMQINKKAQINITSTASIPTDGVAGGLITVKNKNKKLVLTA